MREDSPKCLKISALKLRMGKRWHLLVLQAAGSPPLFSFSYDFTFPKKEQLRLEAQTSRTSIFML